LIYWLERERRSDPRNAVGVWSEEHAFAYQCFFSGEDLFFDQYNWKL